MQEIPQEDKDDHQCQCTSVSEALKNNEKLIIEYIDDMNS